MTRSTRLVIDPAKYVRPKLVEVRGAQVEVSVSPYDIPERISGEYNRDAQQFVIRFVYPVDDEPLETVDRGTVQLRIGKYSQRLHQIALDLTAQRTDTVELKLVVIRAVESLATESKRRARDDNDNYRIAEEVINDQSAELFEPLTAG